MSSNYISKMPMKRRRVQRRVGGRKKRVVRRRRVMRRCGGGILDFIKKHRLVTRGLTAVRHHIPASLRGLAGQAYKLANTHGYGRRRRVRHVRRAPRRKRGRGVLDFIKKHRLVTRGLSAIREHIPSSLRGLAGQAYRLANTHGYGRRRRVVRRRPAPRRRYGRGFFGNLWNGIKSAGRFIKDNKLISRGLALIPHKYAGIASQGASALGLGRRRVVRRRRA